MSVKAASQRKGFSSYAIFRLWLSTYSCKGCRAWVHFTARSVHHKSLWTSRDESAQCQSQRKDHPRVKTYPLVVLELLRCKPLPTAAAVALARARSLHHLSRDASANPRDRREDRNRQSSLEQQL